MSLGKIIRKPIYDKTNMKGIYEEYQKLYDELVQWDRIKDNDTSKLKGSIYGVGYTLSDAPFFGWSGDALKRECRLYKAIDAAYNKLLFALEDGLGIESKAYKDTLDMIAEQTDIESKVNWKQ